MSRYVVSVCVSFLVSISSAYADNESDRRRAMSDAERLVDNIERALSGLTRASSTRPIDDALRSADRLKSTLRDLERVKENDSRARSMLSDYDRNLDELKDVRRPLKTLKDGQFRLKSLEDDCRRKARTLENGIKDALRGGEEDNERRLKDLANQLGRDADSALDQGKRQEREMDRAKSDARSFRTSGSDWNGVERAINNAARGMYDAWERDFDQGKRACEPLTRGDRHSEVSKALSTLKRNRKKRTNAIETARDLLKEASRGVGRVGEARDASGIQTIKRTLGTLQKALKTLDRIKGSDSNAKAMCRQWPSLASETRKSLDALSTQKSVQFKLKGLSSRCDSATKSLSAQAKKAVSKPETASRTALVNAVKVAAKTAKSTLKTADKAEAEMRRAKGAAQRVSGSGPWSDLSQGIKKASGKMASDFEKDVKAVRASCEPVGQGVKERSIAQSLDEISKVLDRVDRLLKVADTRVQNLARTIKGVRDAGGIDAARSTVDEIEINVKTLAKDVDPRAQSRGKAWSGAMTPVRASLAGLKKMKTLEGALNVPTKRCRILNDNVEKAAQSIAHEEALNAFEKELNGVQTESAGIIVVAEKMAKEMKDAHDIAVDFRLSAGPWKAVGAALKGSAGQSFNAFKRQNGLLLAACAEPAKGVRHEAVVGLRKDLQARLKQAIQTAKSAQSKAKSTCDEVAALVAKRAQWAKPITTQSNEVLDAGKRDIKPGTLKVLLKGVERLDQKITAAGARCDTAMKAYLEADTAMELLQGR